MKALWSFDFLIALCSFASNALSLYIMSARRYSLRQTRWIWGGVFLLSGILAAVSMLLLPEGGVLLGYVVSLGLCTLAFFFTSRGNFLRNVFIFSSYINFFLFSISVAQALATRFMNNDPLAVLEFRMILASGFCLVLVYDIRPAFLRAAENIPRGWGALTLLAVIFSSCLMVLAIQTNLFLDVTAELLMFLVMLFVLMASAYLLIFKTIASLSRENRKRQLELEKKFLTHQLDSYEQLERESRKYRHDFRHHNLVLLEYAKQGDCDSIIQYLQEYERTARHRLGGRFCENVTVNSILSAFHQQAEEREIPMTIDVRMRKETSIRDTDLVAILANLLENALKASVLAEGAPWVEITIVHKGVKLMIQCRNSCAKNICFRDGLPQAVGRIGIGITSIVDTAAAYAGDTEFSAENGIFTGRILLNDGPESTK